MIVHVPPLSALCSTLPLHFHGPGPLRCVEVLMTSFHLCPSPSARLIPPPLACFWTPLHVALDGLVAAGSLHTFVSPRLSAAACAKPAGIPGAAPSPARCAAMSCMPSGLTAPARLRPVEAAA